MIPYGEPTSIGVRTVARVTGISTKTIQCAVRRERLLTPNLPDPLTGKQAAWLLCVAAQEISGLIASSRLAANREDRDDGGFRWRISTSDVLALGREWIERDEARSGR